MKVKCPNCSSVGRVPAERIPAAGANIRCPSCALVFFVGGPDSINVVAEADPGRSTLPNMSQTQSLPTLDPSQYRRSVAPSPQAVVQQAPDTLASSSPQNANSSALPLAPDTSQVGEDSRAKWGSEPVDHARRGAGDPEPQASDPEPQASDPEPQASDPEPQASNPEPQASDPEPQASHPEPQASDPEPQASDPEPQASDPDHTSSRVGAGIRFDGLQSDPKRPAHLSGQAAAQPSAEPPADRPSAEKSATSASASAAEGYESAVRSALSSLIGPPAASPAAVASTAAAAPTETADTRSPQAAARTVTSYKIRAQSGIIYDFHDFAAVRKWLGTRASFDDLEVSTDAGNAYAPVNDHPELKDVKPSGVRARTGSLPAISDVRPPQSAVAAPAKRSAITGSVAAVASPRAVTGSSLAVPDDASPAGRNARPSRTITSVGKDKGHAKKGSTIPRFRAVAYVVLVSAAILAAVVYFTPERDPIPNTPAGQHLRWVMEVINNGSSRLTMDDIASHMTAEAFQQAGSAISERLIAMDSWKDVFTILTIREPTPQTYVVVELTTETGNVGYLAIGTEPSAPYKVNLFLAGSGNPPANLLRPPQ